MALVSADMQAEHLCHGRKEDFKARFVRVRALMRAIFPQSLGPEIRIQGLCQVGQKSKFKYTSRSFAFSFALAHLTMDVI